LGEQLEALANQTYRGQWEVIVADNGSTDSTRAVAESFTDRISGLRVIDASGGRGAAAARNRGSAAASGEMLAFCDADDRVESGWLAAMAAALTRHSFVTGAIDHDSLNPGVGSSHWNSHVSSIPLALRFKPYALSGNMGITRRLFEEAGGFPDDMRSVGEDVAFSWNLQLAGHDLHFAPDAIVAYRHRHDLGSLWRQHRGFGFADAVLYRRYREYGLPEPRALSVLAAYARLVVRLPMLLSARSRPGVVRDLAKHWGRIRGSVRERVFYP
jgi:glycosyltransferase involved in cell wall biosynthesis